jgi:glutathione synthase/RimK-type ligase-like ATP-grasp enzyme
MIPPAARTARRIAFATWSKEPSMTGDDRMAANVLHASGFEVADVAWDDASIGWHRFDAVVLRSTWNYHLAFEPFLQWLDRLDSTGAVVMNSTALVRWNAHKAYLLELADKDFHIPETVIVSRGNGVRLADFLDDRGWASAVLKPAVSSNSYRTVLVTRDSALARQADLAAITEAGDAVIQRLVEEVHHEGEQSLVLFGDRLSHAVIKRPPKGEFRVQEQYGGVNVPFTPDRAVVDECRRIVAALPERPVYARVDGVRTATEWLLMEVELIEPTLFLFTSGAGPNRFAAAIAERLAS